MAITPYITSKTALKTYIKQRLGEGVVRVEITDHQLEHAINMAVETFIEKADDGASMRFMQLQTQTDVQKYILPNDVYTVRNIFDSTAYSSQLNVVFPGRFIADTYGATLSTDGGLFSLEVSRQKIEELNFATQVQPIYDFNTSTKELFLLDPPDTGKLIGIIYYQVIDYSLEDSKIYNHKWIKNYATELAREQWGVSTTKFEGTILPSGLQMNPAAFLQKADQEKEKLERELEEVYSLPTDFMVG